MNLLQSTAILRYEHDIDDIADIADIAYTAYIADIDRKSM